ncbi:MAG: hypothetical protein KGL15_01075 [Acidobacteriota bacterium]|nr:hypothetical protein [Acidobacteriota bacterium]
MESVPKRPVRLTKRGRLRAGAVGAALSVCIIAAAVSSASTPRVTTPPVPVTVSGTAVGPGIAPGFVGLATEYWNVENEVGTDPNKPDTAFEQVVRNLSPYGGLSLRIGGDSTDWTWFPIPGMKTPPWVRWTMTPTWAAVTKRLVADLHAHLIIGINMEAGSLKVADAEVHEIRSAVAGSAPITFELGNEPELYSHFAFYHDKAGAAVLGRSHSYSLSNMATQWNQMADALPDVPFAGPGYSGLSALPAVAQFLQESHRLKLLTVHTYPLKSARCDGGANLGESNLFDQASLQGLGSGLVAWTSLARHYGVGVRVDEMNSVTCGGSPSFSKTFGPALWALNILPLYVEAGVAGVNFQSRPYTAQNLIQTVHTHAGWSVQVQPEYYGLAAFARLAPPGSKLLPVPTLPSGLYAWAVRTPQGQEHVVITNVAAGARSVAIQAPGASGSASVETLRAGSGGLWATAGATLGGQTLAADSGALHGTQVAKTVRSARGAYDVTVAPASAAIITFR